LDKGSVLEDEPPAAEGFSDDEENLISSLLERQADGVEKPEDAQERAVTGAVGAIPVEDEASVDEETGFVAVAEPEFFGTFFIRLDDGPGQDRIRLGAPPSVGPGEV
jgi:hypothetical protein